MFKPGHAKFDNAGLQLLQIHLPFWAHDVHGTGSKWIEMDHTPILSPRHPRIKNILQHIATEAAKISKNQQKSTKPTSIYICILLILSISCIIPNILAPGRCWKVRIKSVIHSARPPRGPWIDQVVVTSSSVHAASSPADRSLEGVSGFFVMFPPDRG
jgi:hypothetical protein